MPRQKTAAPHRMGAALTYARRYALFALVASARARGLDPESELRAATRRYADTVRAAERESAT